MRMRPKKNRDARLEKVDYLFASIGEDGFIDIENTFGKNGVISLEIGCGKGAFVLGKAQKEPGELFIAAELVRDIIMMAMEKIAASGIGNVRFLNVNAENIDSAIPSGSVDSLYLNFSDPWPKKRNAKRRLTAPAFLERYKKILAPGGKIYFKTDNKGLFDYSLESFVANGFTVTDVCFDLHGDPVLSKDNVETEYEKNFSAKGFLINCLTAYIPEE